MIYDIESEDDNDQKHKKVMVDSEGKAMEPQPQEDDIPEERIVKDNHFNLLSTKNILGQVRVNRWGAPKVFFFSLDLTKGHLLCYKHRDSKSSTTYYKLSKGSFTNIEESEEKSIMKITTKRNKKLLIEVDPEKDVSVVTNLFNSCFRVKEKDEDQPQYKGYFATLGKGIILIFSKQFKVTSGILISEDTQDASKCKSPHKVFQDNKEFKKKRKKDNMIPATGMFFGSSAVICDVIGGITQILRLSEMINKSQQSPSEPQRALNIGMDNSLLNLQTMELQSDLVVGLIFKPSYGTIDVIVSNLQSSDQRSSQKKIYSDFFKIKPKKLTDKMKKSMKARESTEAQYGISDSDMIIVSDTNTEILYLKKNNGLLQQKDISRIQKLSQELKLDDFDQTKNSNDDLDYDREVINSILDYYKKVGPSIQSSYQDITTEFLILFPSKKPSQGAEENGPKEEEYEPNMEENQDEDIFINCEHLKDRYDNKQLPRVSVYSESLLKYQKKEQILRKKSISIESILPIFNIHDTPFGSAIFRSKYDSDSNPLEDSNSGSNNNLGGISDSTKKMNLFHSVMSDSHNVQDLVSEQQYGFPTINARIKQDTEVITQLTYHEAKENNNNSQQNFDNQLIQELDEESKSSDEEEASDHSDPVPEDDDNVIANAKDENQYAKITLNELKQWIADFNGGYTNSDESRIPEAHKEGGKQNINEEQIEAIRSVGKYMIGEIGRKIISGDFNLTQVSFPIRAMIPKSALQTILYSSILFPYYLGKACTITDKVERLKLIITAIFGNFPVANQFLKPLNPILGETFEASFLDGTKLYSEQISHHPPVSYFLVVGPQDSYKYSGYYNYQANAGWNSLTLKNSGKRKIVFKDGQVINFNFNTEQYGGTFMGTMKHESKGNVIFEDKANDIYCEVKLGKTKQMKFSDALSGTVLHNKKPVSQITGSYLGFINFDSRRYWDFKTILPIQIQPNNKPLPSDQHYRQDRILLQKGQMKQAQKAKEELEQFQRQDATLRKKADAQRVKEQKALAKAQKKK